MPAQKRFWTRGRSILIGIMSGAGITTASIWGAVSGAADRYATEYVVEIVQTKYNELNAPVDSQIQNMRNRIDSCIAPDVRYMRYLVETMVDSDTRQRARNRMTEDAEWRTR